MFSRTAAIAKQLIQNARIWKHEIYQDSAIFFEPFARFKVHSGVAMNASSKTRAQEANIRSLNAPMEHADEELVARAIAGDSWAQEVIYRRYVGRITGVATRLLGSASEAEDLCQDTFVSAFQDLRRLQDPKALGGWLTSIAVNRAHKIFRRRTLRRKLGMVQADTELSALLDRAASKEMRNTLMDIGRILDRASAAQRTCWWLRYGEGYSLQEVAEAHDCSLATAKRKIAGVHKHLEALLRDVGPDSELF